MDAADVVVVGAGVVGCGIARELSKYNLHILVIERAEDVCCGTSKANSGIVHAGFDAKPGTQMARFNVEGASIMEDVCCELDVPFVRNGAFVLCFDEDKVDHLKTLFQQGIENGVKDLKILSGEQVREIEPCVSQEVVAALYAPTSGIVDPFMLTVAYAENAAVNGATFRFNERVESVEEAEDGFVVHASRGSYKTRAVVNATGLFSDDLAKNMPGAIELGDLRITARRGSYVLLDKKATGVPTLTLFQLPTQYGKGVLVSSTCYGNTIVGPTAVDIEDKEETATSAEELSDVLQKARLSVPGLPLNLIITSFAGLRAHEDHHEFVIDETVDRCFNLVGIESPGLTSAPAIAKHVAHEVADRLDASKKLDFQPERTSVPRFYELPPEEQEKLFKQNPHYGRMVCRCEHVTEGEIEDALLRPVPPTTLDGLKRRLRVGMGRCQGGFCSPTALKVLARELECDLSQINKSGPHARIVLDRSKKPLK